MIYKNKRSSSKKLERTPLFVTNPRASACPSRPKWCVRITRNLILGTHFCLRQKSFVCVNCRTSLFVEMSGIYEVQREVLLCPHRHRPFEDFGRVGRNGQNLSFLACLVSMCLEMLPLHTIVEQYYASISISTLSNTDGLWLTCAVRQKRASLQTDSIESVSGLPVRF